MVLTPAAASTVVQATADASTLAPRSVTAATSGAASSQASSRGSRAVLAAVTVSSWPEERCASELCPPRSGDETVTVRDVSGSFGQRLHKVVNHEGSPPFYFICLWIWRHLVSSTAVEPRTLSALAGTMTIALAYYVARQRIGQRGALLLTVCVAVSPVLIYYSTEMRMYGALVLISGVDFEAYARVTFTQRQEPEPWGRRP